MAEKTTVDGAVHQRPVADPFEDVGDCRHSKGARMDRTVFMRLQKAGSCLRDSGCRPWCADLSVSCCIHNRRSGTSLAICPRIVAAVSRPSSWTPVCQLPNDSDVI